MPVPLNAVSPSPEVCVKCKGRLWCGPTCFILDRFKKKESIAFSLKGKELHSHSPPGIFVSWHGYPKVNLSPMAPAVEQSLSDSWNSDDTDKWFGKSADDIISFRENLVRGSKPFAVTQASNPSYELLNIQETIMAKKPVDIEMKFTNSPRSRGLSFSDFHAPMGPQANLDSFSVSENPSVNPSIDRLVSDTDAKAKDAMIELFDKEVGVNQLHKLLSAGMLGVGKRRKLVPTRFSITAIDSNLSEHFVEEFIRYHTKIDDVRLFQSTYLENYYYILLLPQEWSYELLEVWKPGASWNINSSEPQFMSDYEDYSGRHSYAENTAGGYYAVRIAITEYLMRTKRQATAIVFREIGDAGTPSLGVFKCRETARDALKKKPLSFDSLELALKYLESKLSVPLKYYKNKSVILDNLYHQKRITQYF